MIENFYRIYHSVRFHDDLAIVRLNSRLTDEQVQTLEQEFPELILPGGQIICCGPLDCEEDEPDLAALPRLSFPFNHFPLRPVDRLYPSYKHVLTFSGWRGK